MSKTKQAIGVSAFGTPFHAHKRGVSAFARRFKGRHAVQPVFDNHGGRWLIAFQLCEGCPGAPVDQLAYRPVFAWIDAISQMRAKWWPRKSVLEEEPASGHVRFRRARSSGARCSATSCTSGRTCSTVPACVHTVRILEFSVVLGEPSSMDHLFWRACVPK